MIGRRPTRRRLQCESLESRRMLAATPLITEMMAAGQSILPSRLDGQFYDWIEIYNPGPGAVDLKDWYLSDRKAELHGWQFGENYLLAEDEFVVVFASGLDSNENVSLRDIGELHANFRLGANGEYLALVRPDGTTLAAEYEPTYPIQTPGISYGLTASLDEEVYFTTPTPGERNPTYFKNSVFSPQQGFYDIPFRVALDTTVLAGPLHYTTDGSAPSAEDPEYVDWIPIDQTTTLRVKSLAPESDATVYTQTYLFPGAIREPSAARGWPNLWIDGEGKRARADYAFDPEVSEDPRYVGSITESLLSLPTFAVSMDIDDLFSPTRGIYANPTQSGREWERSASIEMLYPDGSGDFQADAGIRVRGGASRESTNTPKHSFRIYFRSQYGPSILGQPIFSDAPVDRFDRLELNAIYDDSWLTPDSTNRMQSVLMRDQWLRETIGDMGQPTVAGRFVHLYLNGVYWGIYNVTERVDDGYGAIRFGGSKLDFDVIDSGRVEEGTGEAWRALLERAKAGVSKPAEYRAMTLQMDVNNFIDFMIARLYAGDGQLGSGDWFAVRNHALNERFRFFVTDEEQILRGVNDNVTNPLNADDVMVLFRSLQQSPAFRRAFGDRVHKHFFNDGALTSTQAIGRWQRIAEVLEPAIVAEAARWGDHRRDMQPQNAGPTELYTPLDHWSVESNRMIDQYFPARSGVVFNQFKALGLYPNLVAPFYTQFGGEIADGYQLNIVAPQGKVYYTLDGSDPLTLAGALRPSAMRYEGPITLTDSVRVRARVQSNDQWSAMSDAVFFLALPLQLTELHVSASPDFQGETGDAFDFVELANVGDDPIDLASIRFDTGIAFSFSDSEVQQLQPGERTVIVQSREAFERRYGSEGILIAGEYTGRLANSDRLVAKGELGQTFFDVTYDSDWYDIVEFENFSLVRRDESQLLTNLSDKTLWRPSYFVDGSPGTSDPGLDPNSVVISEALTHSDGSAGDWLELHNTTDQAIDLSGWYLSGRTSDLRLYKIPEGTILPSGGYVFFTAGDPGLPQVRHGGVMGFNISKLGERIFVTSAGRDETEVGGYRFVADFTYGFNSSSFIRHTNSAGQAEYVVVLNRTPGFPNVSAPAVERIRNYDAPYREAVISEVMFFPQGAGDEFIELYNPHDRELSLELPFGPSWRFTDGVFYNFPDSPAPVLPPKSYTLIVGIDPEQFRQKYDVPAETMIFGPYLGELLNGGERLVLSRAAETAAFVPFSTTDTVHYNDSSANWPAEANGEGASLIRRSYRAYGNDVTNWQAGSYGGTPGRPNQNWAGTSQVIDRMVFYNESVYDKERAAINDDDDRAVAVDKFALLPGQRATFQNYTSYDRGLNGIMIDVRNLAGVPTASDLEFRVGGSDDPADWQAAPPPLDIQLRRQAGYDQSDRLVVTWENGAITNQWLQVRVKATAATGLLRDDIFYFGNAIGETGDAIGTTYVDGTDYARVRNQFGTDRLIEETDIFDIDRNGRIGPNDARIVAQNVTNLKTALPLLLAPGEAREAPAATAIDQLSRETKVLGDVNQDGLFDAVDLQQMAATLAFDAADAPAKQGRQGDWNNDGLFNSQDLVLLFQLGHFAGRPVRPVDVRDWPAGRNPCEGEAGAEPSAGVARQEPRP